MNQRDTINALLDAIEVLHDSMQVDGIKTTRYRHIMSLQRHLRETPDETFSALHQAAANCLNDIEKLMDSPLSSPELMVEAGALEEILLNITK